MHLREINRVGIAVEQPKTSQVIVASKIPLA